MKVTISIKFEGNNHNEDYQVFRIVNKKGNYQRLLEDVYDKTKENIKPTK